MIIAGTWNDNGGSPSGYMNKLRDALDNFGDNHLIWNGGYYSDLEKMIENLDPSTTDNVILWFPDISNDKPKLVRRVKQVLPTATLVTSKRNDNDKYQFVDLVARALQAKANLSIEFKKIDGVIAASVFDPLGNVYCKDTQSIAVLAGVLTDRFRVFENITRLPSRKIGESLTNNLADNVWFHVWFKEFVNLVEKYADRFHELIHGANPSRLLGNCSFRCTKGGFPSMRHVNNGKELILVSRRNVDKRFVGEADFVAVEPSSLGDYLDKDMHIDYYGDNKPSVDTPIQLALYALYPRINFMLHSHTYIEGAPFTENALPCGALEEVEEIVKAVRDNSVSYFAVNLKGHGSIIASKHLDDLYDIPYITRNVPELIV